MRVRSGRLPLLIPEIVQTSAMDCGPASLKCLLEGFGIPVSYDRLREACQTDVDGTSIDTLEEVAIQLGLEAEQVLLPVDHVLLREADALPALAVVRLPTGATHFVILWRHHGGWVQVMDPATGRRWPRAKTLSSELYLHKQAVPAADWREWAGSEDLLRPLRARLDRLGVPARTRDALVGDAQADAGWEGIAALDAATRCTDAIVQSTGLSRGAAATRSVEALFRDAASDPGAAEPTIPVPYWLVRPVPSPETESPEPEQSESGQPGPERTERLTLRGAVLLRVRGRRAASPAPRDGFALGPQTEPSTSRAPLSPELAAALREVPTRPGAQLLSLLRADGWMAPGTILVGLAVAAAGVAAEALILRGLLELGGELGLVPQRIGAIASIALFLSLLLGLEVANRFGLLRVGRRLEARLRMAFARKIPRLDDAYFRSRLASDMAHRAHSIHELRLLAPNGGRFVQLAFTTVFTAMGIIWLDPGAAFPASLAVLTALGIPVAAQTWLRESDLRVRTHAGALSRFSLDAMLGLTAIRACGAERSIRREQESLLAQWASAGAELTRDVLLLHAVQSLASLGFASWIFFDHVARVGETGAVLLLLYWVLHLPILARELTVQARQYPKQRNLTARLLEPLGAPETARSEAPVNAVRAPQRAAELRFSGLSVRKGGHDILKQVDLHVAPGSHLAIVGVSGAGKSSLVGLLLGWCRPEAGTLEVDGEPLVGASLDQLRRETAWVDPQVRLWNRTLLENLHYGTTEKALDRTQEALRLSDLREVVGQLPLGLQTRLGDGGALMSGGEGQRLRFGRALVRDGIRLAILDEPFRSLGRQQRHGLLGEARRVWSEATLLCVTHEIGETLAFPRVLVVDAGRIVEDGVPVELAAREDSRFRRLLDAEHAVEAMWADPDWKQFHIADGHLVPGGSS